MSRLVGPVLPAAERSCQRGERGGQTLPQIAGVGVGAGLEQQVDAREARPVRRVVGDPGVAGVEQRWPVIRTASPVGGGGILDQELSQVDARSGRGGGVEVGPGQLGLLGQERGRRLDPFPTVGPVGQTGQPEQLLGRVGSLRQPVRVAPPGLDHPQVRTQLRPAGEVVRPGHRQLGVRQLQRGGVTGQSVAARVEGAQQFECLGVAGPAAPQPVLGLPPQLLEIGAGQPHRRRCRGRWCRRWPCQPPVLSVWVPHAQTRTEDVIWSFVKAQVGSALSRGWWRPARRGVRVARTGRGRCSRRRAGSAPRGRR